MLTDPVGRAVEVSTTSYRPTPALWAQVTAMRPTCFGPGCDHASTLCDLDHRAKHTHGFANAQTRDGSFALRTSAGFLHRVVEPEHPATDEWIAPPSAIQFSATELTETLRLLREQDAERRVDLEWEHAIHVGWADVA